MDTLLVMLGNWKTTLIGFVGAVALYVVNNGVKMPHTPDQWWTFAFCALLAGLGLAAKDATTGSRPLLALASTLMLAGCALTTGYAGRHPGVQDFECGGEGSVTGTGTLAVGAGAGGAETNSFSVTFKCGERAYFRRSQGVPSGNLSVTGTPK